MNTITFITGANKGLGYETARRLTELGHTVILGARDPQRGKDAAERLGVRFVQIDVTDDLSVQRAAADIEEHEGRVDTLVNNAGIIGSHAAPADLTGADAELVFETNAISVESTIAAPLYTASKAAVTMLTMQYAKALPGIRFNAVDPGYTSTDFNGHRGTQTASEGTDAIVALATEPAAAGTGRFVDRFGPVPW